MSMTQLVIVLSASNYKFTDDKTGKLIEGTSVQLVYSDDLKPCTDRDSVGYKPAKITLPYESFAEFKVVPAIYEVTLGFAVDGAGKATIKPKCFNFVSNFTVTKAATASATTADMKS
jgi:hypothetical protein